MSTTQILNETIDLFLEYRDKHGYDEERAKSAAVCEVLEGLAAETQLPVETGGAH